VFALLSKLLDFLLMPTVWVAVLLGIGLWRRSRKVLATAFVLLLFFCNGYIANSVLNAYEVAPTPLAALTHRYKAAVVLGGFTHLGRQPADRVYLNAAADRIFHSILLYKKGFAQHLLITGGNGVLVQYRDTEAGNASALAQLCGVPNSAIWLEPRARTTRENALFSKEILARHVLATDTVLLVTSAFHARRALGCFKKVGVPCRLFTADIRSGKPLLLPDQLLVPTTDALAKWDMLLHEWAGLAMYKLAGYL